MSEEPARYGNYDPIVTLRLELGREKARADAFEAALRKEVRDAIVKAIKDAAKYGDARDKYSAIAWRHLKHLALRQARAEAVAKAKKKGGAK